MRAENKKEKKKIESKLTNCRPISALTAMLALLFRIGRCRHSKRVLVLAAAMLRAMEHDRHHVNQSGVEPKFLFLQFFNSTAKCQSESSVTGLTSFSFF